MKFCPVGAELFLVGEGWAGIKLTGAFHNSAKEP
jgi:hypothetical protein